MHLLPFVLGLTNVPSSLLVLPSPPYHRQLHRGSHPRVIILVRRECRLSPTPPATEALFLQTSQDFSRGKRQLMVMLLRFRCSPGRMGFAPPRFLHPPTVRCHVS
jgi:hypothetical protein